MHDDEFERQFLVNSIYFWKNTGTDPSSVVISHGQLLPRLRGNRVLRIGRKGKIRLFKKVSSKKPSVVQSAHAAPGSD